MRDGKKKFILKEVVHKHIPREMMERPKMGFGIPLKQWLRNELKPLVNDHLQSGSLGHDFFEQSEVDALLKDFYNGTVDEPQKVWSLLMFQMWYSTYMK
jgi:asparagine synthase (glutamine-hydrolysing)